MTDIGSTFEGDDSGDDVHGLNSPSFPIPRMDSTADLVAETLRMDSTADLVAETLKMNPLNDLLQENSRLGKSVLESIRPSIDMSAWAGLAKASVLDTSAWSSLTKASVLDTSVWSSLTKGSALDTAKLMGSFNPAFGMTAALTQLHQNVSILPEEVLKQFSDKIAFYNPKSPVAAVQMAEADTEFVEAAKLALTEHPDEVEELIAISAGKRPAEMKELSRTQVIGLTKETLQAVGTTVGAGLTITYPPVVLGTIIFAVVLYALYIIQLEAEVQESRGVDEAGQ